MATGSGRPMRVAVVDDYEIVVAGIGALLCRYRDRITMVELGVEDLPAPRDVDIVLYDAFGRHDHDLAIEELSSGGDTKIVVFSWSPDPDRVRRALDTGAAGYVVKSLPADEIVDALERVHAGETVVPTDPAAGVPDPSPRRPGRQVGLSNREAEAIALIAQGLSNREIADRLYLSVNSVKTYIRTAYRRMGVTRRSQAVRWALEHDVAEASDPAATGRVDPRTAGVNVEPRETGGH